MKNAIPMLIIIAIGVLIAVVDDLTRKRRLLRYWRRPCMGPEWRRIFPDVPKADIRNVLDTFSDAFMFTKDNRLKFSPMDRVIDVYRTVYPPGSAVDAMELETFALTLERKCGIDLVAKWKPEETTLADIFTMGRRGQGATFNIVIDGHGRR